MILESRMIGIRLKGDSILCIVSIVFFDFFLLFYWILLVSVLYGLLTFVLTICFLLRLLQLFMSSLGMWYVVDCLVYCLFAVLMCKGCIISPEQTGLQISKKSALNIQNFP